MLCPSSLLRPCLPWLLVLFLTGSVDAQTYGGFIGPIAIPDGGSPCGTILSQVTSSVTVPQGLGCITDVNVTLGLTHTWYGDVVATVSHGGITVTLMDTPAGGCGDSSDLGNLYILDDEAATTFDAAASAYSPTQVIPLGLYRPDNPLAAFDGINPSGLWTFSVSDRAIQDTGSWNYVAVTLLVSSCPLPDLQAMGLSAPAGGTCYVGTTQTVQISFTVINNSSIPVGSFTTGIYLSTDQLITTSDCLIHSHTQGIAGNGTITPTLNVTIPSYCQYGSNQYWGIIADPSNSVPESNEGNNAWFFGPCTVFNSGPFMVSGYAAYDDMLFNSCGFTGSAVKPMRDARVEVWEVNGASSTPIIGAISATLTDDSFAVVVPDNLDPEGGPRDVQLRVKAQNVLNTVQVRSGTSSVPWSILSYTYTNVLGAPLNVGTINPVTGYDGIGNIFDVMQMGHDFVAAQPNTPPPCLVYARWEPNWTAMGTETSQYFGDGYCGVNPAGGLQDEEIWIEGLGSDDDADEFDDSVILHEYGHAIAHLYQFLGWGGAHCWSANWANFYSNQPNLTCQAARALAWSEGWAKFFSSAVRGQPFYLETVGTGISCGLPSPPLNLSLDLEMPSPGCFGAPLGGDCEGAIAAVLWDILDNSGSSETFDTLAMGFSPIWLVVDNAAYWNTNAWGGGDPSQNTLAAFWTGWFGSGLGLRDAMYQLFDDRNTHFIPALQQDAISFASVSSQATQALSIMTFDGGGNALGPVTWSATWSVLSAPSWLSVAPTSGPIGGTTACSAPLLPPVVSGTTMLTANAAGRAVRARSAAHPPPLRAQEFGERSCAPMREPWTQALIQELQNLAGPQRTPLPEQREQRAITSSDMPPQLECCETEFYG